jgi:hypothetical protein
MTMILDLRTLTIFDGATPPQSAHGSPAQARGVALARARRARPRPA